MGVSYDGGITENSGHLSSDGLQGFNVTGITVNDIQPPPFTPASLAGTVRWWDPYFLLFQERASQTTPCVNGDPVGSWVDKLTGALLIAPSNATRSTYRIVGGKPYSDYDATDDAMASTIDLTGACTLAFGASQAGNGVQRLLSAQMDNSLMSLRRNDALRSFVNGDVCNNNIDYVGPHTMILTKAAGGNWKCYVDGADVTNVTTNSNEWHTMVVGATGFVAEVFNGKLADLVLTNSLTSPANVALLNAFMLPRAT